MPGGVGTKSVRQILRDRICLTARVGINIKENEDEM